MLFLAGGICEWSLIAHEGKHLVQLLSAHLAHHGVVLRIAGHETGRVVIELGVAEVGYFVFAFGEYAVTVRTVFFIEQLSFFKYGNHLVAAGWGVVGRDIVGYLFAGIALPERQQ